MNKFEETLVRLTEKRFTKKLTKQQITRVLNLYREVDINVFIGHDPKKVIVILSKIFSEKLKEDVALMNETPGSFDLHEYQKNLIESDDLSDSIVNKIDQDTKQDLEPNSEPDLELDLQKTQTNTSPIYPDLESPFVHYYLVLDSNYRDTNNENPSNITKFTWRYAPTQQVETGFCNSVGTISNIVGMRMYQPRIPYRAAMATTANRISVLIEEFSSQSFIAENGRRFHFLLRPNFISGQTEIELSTEDYNDGIYNFNKPIQTLSSMTVSFGDPLNIISFVSSGRRFILPFEFTCLKET